MIEHRFIDGKIYEAKGPTERLHIDSRLAGLSARLEVSADVVRPMGAAGAESWRTVKHWALILVMSGPDMRYSPGILSLNASTWEPFIHTIRDAVIRLKSLATRSVSATYTRSLSDSIAIETEGGAAYLKVVLKSGTNAFTKRYELTQAVELLEELERIPQTVTQLMGELEALS